VVDGLTGESRPVQIFVAVLGASSFTYAEAVWSQSLPDWISAHVNALAFFGGVPRQIVCDNLRSGITRACLYEPMVNRTYADMARHYGTAVIPARPYKARDKAKVEVGVQVCNAGSWPGCAIGGSSHLAELNSAIRELVVQLNDRPMRGWGTTRRALFEQVIGPRCNPCRRRPMNTPIGSAAGSISTTISRSQRHYYSVPFQLLRQDGRGADHRPKTVEIFHRGKLVATHLRSLRPHRPTTMADTRVLTAIATGRMSGSGARPARSATTPRR
jgi:hypothetical protein